MDVPDDLGPLAAADGEAGKAARLAVTRCLLVSEQKRLPLGVGFREVTTLSNMHAAGFVSVLNVAALRKHSIEFCSWICTKVYSC